jgi:hypothetical protein
LSSARACKFIGSSRSRLGLNLRTHVRLPALSRAD